MGATGGVNVSLEGADRAILQLDSLGRTGAIGLRQAINTTARKGRTLLVREVTSSLNLKPGYVRERVDLRLSTGAELKATIRAKKREILLSRFAARQITAATKGKTKAGKRRARTRAGISVQVKQGGARKILPGAFFVTLKNSGAQAIAIRDPAGGKYASGKSRFEVLYGPSVIQHFGLKIGSIAQQLRPLFLAEAERQYQRRLPHGLA